MGSVDTAGLLLDLKMSHRFLTIHPWVLLKEGGGSNDRYDASLEKYR